MPRSIKAVRTRPLALPSAFHKPWSWIMQIRMSKNLELWVDQIIGFNWQAYQRTKREAAIADVLAFLEAQGDAQRLLKPNGKIRWIATRQLRDHIQ
jgi:hypothetical protein